ncbi:MAG TPA: TonB-dependent receptor [Bacteroidia bacterium]|nr:TonB-dependent receptor [Bacteroidia bacterium]
MNYFYSNYIFSNKFFRLIKFKKHIYQKTALVLFYGITHFLFFTSTSIYSQTPKYKIVYGKVSDSDNEFIPGSIILIDKKHNTLSDLDGNYVIKLPKDFSGKHFLECSYVGYTTFTTNIEIPENKDSLQFNIVLNKDKAVLEEVVVSAGKYEQNITDVTVSMDVLKPTLIENKNTTQLDQIMNQVPGVNVYDSQISIRGGSGFSYGAGSRVLMLVDEIPMISADANDIKWNYLPLETTEQVEVIKGAASALYGSSALNGVINLRTMYAKSKPYTNVTLFTGSYDAPKNLSYKWWKGTSQFQRGVNFAHGEKIDNWDVVIGGHMFSDDGYRMLETEDRGRLNANIRYNFKKVPGLSAGINTNMMNTKGGLFFLWQNADSVYIPQGKSIQRYNNNRFNVDPFINYVFGSNKITLRGRYFLTQNRNDKNQEANSELYYSELQYQKRWRNYSLTAGTLLMYQQVYSDSLYGRHTGKNIAGYVQWDGKFFDKLNVTVGLRGEYYRVDTAYTRGYLNDQIKDLPFQPVARIGVNYQLFKYTFVRASYGQGYRFPSVAEKYVSTNVSSLKIFPNKNLQPERGYSAELGIKQAVKLGNWKGYADVSAFYMEYRNMVEFVFNIYAPNGPTGFWLNDLPYAGFMSQNIGNALIKGFETSLMGTGNIGPVNVTLFSGYTYIDPVMLGFDPKRDTLGLPGIKTLKYRNKHLFKNDIQLDWKFISIGWSTRYQSFMENIDRRFVESIFKEYGFDLPIFYILPGLKEYREKEMAHKKGNWIHDARIGFMITKNLKVSYVVNNVFNEEYSSRPGDVRPPRQHFIQIQVKI